MLTILKRSKESDSKSKSVDAAKLGEMELRLRSLEDRILQTADDLHSRICDSLDRIEERFECEILPSTVNPFDRMSGPSTVASAGDALSEFSNTINLARKHLEALSKSISVMRGKVSKD